MLTWTQPNIIAVGTILFNHDNALAVLSSRCSFVTASLSYSLCLFFFSVSCVHNYDNEEIREECILFISGDSTSYICSLL